MLPAPGAHMLSAAHQPGRHQKPESNAKLPSAQEDPIVATAWQSKMQSGKGMQTRRKPGSKTWTTLNLQQAPLGAQLSRQVDKSDSGPIMSRSHPASGTAMMPVHVAQNQQPILCPTDDKGLHAVRVIDAVEAAHDMGSPQKSEAFGSNRLQPAADQAEDLPDGPLNCMQGVDCHSANPYYPDRSLHAHATLQLPGTTAVVTQSAQHYLPPPAHAAAFLPQLALEGSETQPELSLCQGTAEDALHTHLGQPADAAKPVNEAHFCNISSQVAVPQEVAASPACENIPDSSGNTFAASEGHARHVSQHDQAASVHDVDHVARYEGPHLQGWHVQLAGPVFALLSLGR